ncbi:BatD family protein [Capnocytophaga leadbetteri]|uniref:BatD family protein n=1 Tax=Capnocytophaga leadbetteri TaxID=327575 RepID=UPI0028E29FAA|nr:BatD family protein [Capnocytophaga leadbetteri]
MFGKKGSSLYYLFFLLTFTSVYTQEVSKKIDKSIIKIGEQIHYKISVENSNGNVVTFPEGQTFMPLEMVKARDTDTIRNGASYTLIKEYYLTQFDEGKYTIPRQRVRISDKDYYLDSLQIEVHTVAIDTLKQPLYDIKPIQEVKKPFTSYGWILTIIAAVLLLLIVAFVYFVFIRKKKFPFLQTQKKLPPFDRAIQDLKELQNSKYLIQSQHKEYYTRLTDIVKVYLEEEVHILAKESTTDELLTKINLLQEKGKLNLNQETITNLKRVLQTADLVKFAKNKPSDDNAEYDRETIENVVIKTQEAIPLEPTDEQAINEARQKALALKRKKRKRLLIRIGVGILLFFLLGGVGLYFGYRTLKNWLFNPYVAELNEGKWVTSDYGYPITELTTPKVLMRKQIVDITGFKPIIHSQSTFYFGSLNSELYIMTNIITFVKETGGNGSERGNGNISLDPQLVNEIVLAQLDKAGAKNITTLQEEYTTPAGVKGMKVFGEMTLSDKNGNPFKANYELYSFTENGALQQLLITYINDFNAKAIAKRVVNSIAFKTE